MRLIILCSVLVGVLFVTGCSKSDTGSESAFYGTWTKGNSFGDTLWFMKKNGQNIMRRPMSFNAGMPVYSENEFRVRNGLLEVKLYTPTSQDYYPINSFSWVQAGKEFSLLGYEIYFFMSSRLQDLITRNSKMSFITK